MSIKMVPSTVPTHLNSFNNIFNKDRLPFQDQACHDGQNWVTIAQVPGVAQATTPPSETAAQQTQTVAPKQSVAKKTVAAKTKQNRCHI